MVTLTSRLKLTGHTINRFVWGYTTFIITLFNLANNRTQDYYGLAR